MLIWKEKFIKLKLHKSIKTFNILIQQCHHIVWSVAKKKKKKKTERKYLKVVRTKNGRIILLSKCAVCESKHDVAYGDFEDSTRR